MGAVALSLMLTTKLEGQAPWSHQRSDSLHGSNIVGAKLWLKKQAYKPKTKPIVAIIDSGIDTTTRAIRPALWHNPKELADGIDNDGNGYIDDLHGWNFLGTKDGSFDMISAGTEEFREFKRLYPKYKNAGDKLQSDSEYAHYREMKRRAGIERYLRLYEYTQAKDAAFAYIDSVLRHDYPTERDTLSRDGLMHKEIASAEWQSKAELIITELLKAQPSDKWTLIMSGHYERSKRIAQRVASIEQETDKRLLMGDKLDDASDIYYGNNHLMVEGYEHGNFVAGVVAAKGDSAVMGVYPAARLMILRAVPDGDEYDKDIATAIRYAVDNGAKVINMSLGKYESPQRQMVDEAIAYAGKHDVVVLQAAGNEGHNLDSIAYYPMAREGGRTMPHFLRVGASTKAGGRLRSSNYSGQWVDVFAPGEDIRSYMSGNVAEASQGTSLATPLVSGIVAMMRAYFPELSAVEIKNILVRSSRPMLGEHKYAVGGVVDALAAVQEAAKLARSKRAKKAK